MRLLSYSFFLRKIPRVVLSAVQCESRPFVRLSAIYRQYTAIITDRRDSSKVRCVSVRFCCRVVRFFFKFLILFDTYAMYYTRVRIHYKVFHRKLTRLQYVLNKKKKKKTSPEFIKMIDFYFLVFYDSKLKTVILIFLSFYKIQ